MTQSIDTLDRIKIRDEAKALIEQNWENFVASAEKIGRACYLVSKSNGFWDDEERNKGEMIALIHSELSECLEAVRKPRADDHLPGFENEAVELADTFIRLADYAEGFSLNFYDAIIEKLVFNTTRGYKHGKSF